MSLKQLDAVLIVFAILCAAAFALLFWVWDLTMALVGQS